MPLQRRMAMVRMLPVPGCASYLLTGVCVWRPDLVPQCKAAAGARAERGALQQPLGGLQGAPPSFTWLRAQAAMHL